MRNRDYSWRVQRLLVDFAADHSFSQASRKIKEHHNLKISENAIRVLTYKHSQLMQKKEKEGCKNKPDPVEILVVEADGSMIPVVKSSQSVDSPDQDRRKNKIIEYQEIRLSMARDARKVDGIYAATMGDAYDVGRQMKRCAQRVGYAETTRIHAVGDGAPWIATQVREQFGDKAVYILDFYHLSSYLSAAGKTVAQALNKKESDWMECQKDLLKQGKAGVVLEKLQLYIEDESLPDEEAPVRVCIRYLGNRLEQCRYNDALEKGLPIGSGEIESAHKRIIQSRLKKTGAAWKAENAQIIAALRSVRENRQWEEYWRRAA